MKKRKVLCSLLIALCVSLLAPAASLAEEEQQGDGYRYTVRIYAGNQGTYQGQSVVEIPGCYPHQQITFNLRDVVLENGSKYYVRGIRESGRDDAARSAFTVEGDTDYVIVYGILSNMTSYVIHYVDITGRSLAPSETYYGNVGDKPVVAYLYIEGYQPQAYNLTKTLSENTAENVFTFIYGTDEEATSAAAEETTGAAETTAAAAQGTSAAASQAEETASEGETTQAAADEPVVPIDDAQLPLGNPEDVLDLDEIEDDRLPLADKEGESGILTAIVGEARLLGAPLGIVLVAGAVLLGAALWLLFLFLRKKKKKEEQETIGEIQELAESEKAQKKEEQV